MRPPSSPLMIVVAAHLLLAADPATTLAQRAIAPDTAPPWSADLARLGDRTASDCSSAPSTMRDPCDRFVGLALQRVHGLADFSDAGGAPLTTAAIADSLALGAWPRWRRVATIANDDQPPALQAALHAVAAHAENGGAVIAMHRPGNERAQLALVLPRRPTGRSVVLQGAAAPRVACVIRGRPHAFVDVLLSYCFKRAQRPIELFVRASDDASPPHVGQP